MKKIGALLLLAPALLCAQVGGVWEDLGPAPATDGQVEGIQNGEVVGAVNALAPHPTNADILYVAAVNGGIWRTGNATASFPNWTRQTDALGSLSLTSLEFDPTDTNRQTLVAGSGRNSSLSGIGGALIGMLRTTDGGTTWVPLAGAGGTLANQQIRGVAGRGAILLASAIGASGGVFRSTDTGANFTLVSGAGGSGLPLGSVSDLAASPTDNAVFYVPVISGTPGVYRSTDTGATWSKVSDSTMDTQITGSTRARIVVGNGGQVYVAVIRAGRLSNVYRSGDGSSGWADLGVPTTIEAGGVALGAHPGGQGGTHFSMAADPTDVNVVFLAGDRQPFFGEGNGTNVFFPNGSGANDYSGRSFRGESGASPVWRNLTHNGTASNSSPHADSRDMAFAANGVLIESDDGGVYRRLQPNSTAGDWQSMNGNLQTTEYHSLAYDRVSDRVIGGAQDTGTPEEDTPANKRFRSVSTADGGDVAVNDVGSTTQSVRYNSFQNLGAFRRRALNASNVVTSTAFPARTPTDGNAMTAQFYTPITVNQVNGLRIVFGASNGVFESLNQADTITRVSTLRVNQIVGSPLVYGIPGNEDLLYFGSGSGLHLRTAAGGSVSALATLGASNVVDVDIDPSVNPTGTNGRLFALSSSAVFYSTNTGVSFGDVTGNLITSFAPGLLRSMAFIPNADAALVVATDRGTFVARSSSGYTNWLRLGSNLPNVPVFELDYDAVANVLAAGTMGRGAWKLRNPLGSTASLFANGFE
jgi:hypothetical protein